MALRPILWHPDPVLKEKCDPVDVFDDQVRSLVRDMAETMYAAPGVGLAAPQVGVTRRVFVIDVRDKDAGDAAKLRVFINPRIVEKKGEIVWEEGCLSIPGLTEEISRAERVRVAAQDENGTPFELEAEGLLAVAIQHENDHLDGILMFDRLSPLRRKFALRKYKRELAKRMDEDKAAQG